MDDVGLHKIYLLLCFLYVKAVWSKEIPCRFIPKGKIATAQSHEPVSGDKPGETLPIGTPCGWMRGKRGETGPRVSNYLPTLVRIGVALSWGWRRIPGKWK